MSCHLHTGRGNCELVTAKAASPLHSLPLAAFQEQGTWAARVQALVTMSSLLQEQTNTWYKELHAAVKCMSMQHAGIH